MQLPFPGTECRCYYDERGIPELDDNRYCYWWFPCIRLVYFGWYSVCKDSQSLLEKKINPLIGATGLSAVPMASRVCNEIATKYDPKNHVLNYCMSSNISGVIGSAVAAGVLISFLG